jgi:hypothetical protein
MGAATVVKQVEDKKNMDATDAEGDIRSKAEEKLAAPT